MEGTTYQLFEETQKSQVTDKLKKRKIKKNHVNILKDLTNHRKVKLHEAKDDTAFMQINGWYHCPECSYKSKWGLANLKEHINAVHRKLKPWKCSVCTKDFSKKAQLTGHVQTMHNSNKRWICDCCGSRFGIKKVLREHVKTHLPPSFSCSKCDKKFGHPRTLARHTKLHQGILNEICKLCRKGHPTKARLVNHIISYHFEKLVCEVTGCLTNINFKDTYKQHLIKKHKKDDQVLIGKLLEKVKKLKPNYQQLKYV